MESITTTKPRAIVLAETAVTNKLQIVPTGLTTINKRRNGMFSISYQHTAESKTELIAIDLDITDEEFSEYKAWFNTILLEKADRINQRVTEKLRDAGFYVRNSAGLTAAIKIYNIISMSSKPIGSIEIIAEERRVIEEQSPLALTIIGSKATLAGPTGGMSITGRRALTYLAEAGLIKKTGSTKMMKYSTK